MTDERQGTPETVTHTEVRVVSLDIPIDQVFWLVIKFTFAGVIVGGTLGLIVAAIIIGLR